jgi:hypothetical protein
MDYLAAIYASIQKKPLALHEKEKQKKFLEVANNMSFKKKQEMFVKET